MKFRRLPWLEIGLVAALVAFCSFAIWDALRSPRASIERRLDGIEERLEALDAGGFRRSPDVLDSSNPDLVPRKGIDR